MFLYENDCLHAINLLLPRAVSFHLPGGSGRAHYGGEAGDRPPAVLPPRGN
eukprot:COSAG06_NODE_23854_length_679_cov_1.467241_1_plen_50_part_10